MKTLSTIKTLSIGIALAMSVMFCVLSVSFTGKTETNNSNIDWEKIHGSTLNVVMS
jgi:hypothetical protein